MSQALSLLEESDERTLADQLALVQVPAPTFAEGERASVFMDHCREIGLVDIRRDEVGNVLARVPGTGPEGAGAEGNGPAPILVAAHLDTVFPAETDLTLRRSGDRYLVPGIGDNARGLTALLALGRVMVASGIRTTHPIILIGSVGEEGLGDLYGVKHLFREGSEWRGAAAFIAVDGTGLSRIVNRATGSHRLRVTISGPGGHSWVDWGLVNPIHVVGRVISELSGLVSPDDRSSTLTVGRVGGGTSINTIPSEAWLEIDMRSGSGTRLEELARSAREVIERTAQEAGQVRRAGTPELDLEIKVLGNRPAGTTAPDSELVRAASAATEFIGKTPELAASSTDANVPISLGIPAITLGAGGDSGGAHTVDEWYDNTGSVPGLQRVLLTLLGVAGIVQEGAD